MGWFGKRIMDGDSPMDWLGVMLDILGISEETMVIHWELPTPEIRALIETRQHMLVSRIGKEHDTRERNIGWQVLATLIMAQGAEMMDKVRKLATDALKADEWAKTDLERKIYVEDMLDILAAYDNRTPTANYADWTIKYGVTEDQVKAPQLSWKMLNAAMCEVAEHLKEKKWFRGMRFSVNRAGYRMLIIISEKDIDGNKGAVLHDDDVPASLYDIPVGFYVEDQNTVKKAGDKIYG